MPNGAEQFADARSSAVPEKWETIGLTMKIFVKGCEGNCNGIQSVDPPAEKTSEQMGKEPNIKQILHVPEETHIHLCHLVGCIYVTTAAVIK